MQKEPVMISFERIEGQRVIQAAHVVMEALQYFKLNDCEQRAIARMLSALVGELPEAPHE